MVGSSNRRRMSGFFVFYFLAWPSIAHAYIDPGTGSFLLQMILTIFLGAAVGIKGFWIKVKSMVSSLFSKKK